MRVISDGVKKQVYKKYDGRCAYCGKPIGLFSQMQVNHLLPTYWKIDDAELAAKNLVRGTDHILNLMPCCKRCNWWKKHDDLEAFRAQISEQPNVMLRDMPGYKLALDFGLVQEVAWDGKFYFERMPAFSISYRR